MWTSFLSAPSSESSSSSWVHLLLSPSLEPASPESNFSFASLSPESRCPLPRPSILAPFPSSSLQFMSAPPAPPREPRQGSWAVGLAGSRDGAPVGNILSAQLPVPNFQILFPPKIPSEIAPSSKSRSGFQIPAPRTSPQFRIRSPITDH